MVKLPDWTNVGTPTVQNPGREIHTYNIGDATQGIKEWGDSFRHIESGLKAIGAGITKAAGDFEAEGKKQTDFQVANANSDFLVERIKLDAERQKVTDPAKLPEYTPKYDAALQRGASQILDPEERQRWLTSHAPQAAETNAQIQGQDFKLKRDAYRGKTDAGLTALRETALTATDEKTSAAAIAAAQDLYSKGADAGYYTREEAEEKRQKWVTDYAFGKVKTMSPEERLTAAGAPLPGSSPATSSASPATGPMPSGRDIMGAHGDPLWSFKAPNGQSLTTNKEAAWRFNGLLGDLAKDGYPLKDVGGYNNRLKRGGTTLSEHAHGNAIDINPLDNPMGPTLVTNLPPDISQRAAKWGLTWGGDWKGRKDAMHFEYKPGGRPQASSPTAPTQDNARGKTVFDGLVKAGLSPIGAAGLTGRLQVESEFNPNARNIGDGKDGSDSIGILQWNADRAKDLKTYAASSGQQWNDVQTQISFIKHEGTGKEKAAWGKLLAAKTVEEAAEASLAMARPKGWEGGLSTASGGRETLENARRIHAGNFGGSAMSPTGGVPARRNPIFQYIPEDKRQDIIRGAHEEIRRRDSENAGAIRQEKETLTVLKESDKQSIMETGQPVGTISPERVAGVEGEEAGRRFHDLRAAQSEYHTQTKGMQGKPEPELDRDVESLKPADGDALWAPKNDYYQKARKDADKILELRRNDPAAAMDQMPALKEKARDADINNPASMIPLANARMAMQAHLGIPENRRSPITKAEGEQLWRPVKDAEDTDKDEAIGTFIKTLEEAFGPQYARQAFNQIMRQERVKEEQRGLAFSILNKLTNGEKLTRHDGRALDAAKTRDTANTAMGNIAPSKPPVREDHRKRLLANPTDEEQRLFDGAYGEGAARAALKR